MVISLLSAFSRLGFRRCVGFRLCIGGLFGLMCVLGPVVVAGPVMPGLLVVVLPGIFPPRVIGLPVTPLSSFLFLFLSFAAFVVFVAHALVLVGRFYRPGLVIRVCRKNSEFPRTSTSNYFF